MGSSKNALPNVGERSNSSTNRAARAPKLSIQRTKSFDQQVKRLIAESVHGNSKAALGKQLLQDQQTRLSFNQQTKLGPQTPSQMGFIPHLNLYEKSSFVANAVARFIQGSSQKPQTPVFRRHYTESGRKLHDTSIQAVLTDQTGQEESVTNLSILSRRLRKMHRSGRLASPTLGGRLGAKSIERSSKATSSMILPSTIQQHRSTSRSKSNFMEGPKILPDARKTNGSKVGSQIIIPKELSKESSNRFNPVIEGSLEGSLYKPQSRLNITPDGSVKNRPLITSKLAFEESKKNSVEIASPDEKSKKVIVTKMHSVPGIQHSSRSFQPVRSSFRGEYSSLRGQKNSKEPLLRPDHRQSLLSKSKKGSYQKSESASVPPNLMRSSGEESKPTTIQPTESMLKEMLKYCRCPDIEELGEVEMPEVEIDVDFFRQSTENVSDKRSKIKSVTRSPFERKDRAARAAFAKELEQIEIAEIEKNKD
uniref:PTS system mannitol-specific EIICBA component n=1 Tax=Lygus hesperus TaxID=30085 RepID=A0A0A9Y4C2_LYGHE